MSANKSRTKLVRSLRSGQVTIPAEFRRELGIEDDSLLQITLDEGELRIRPVHLRETPEAGSLKALYAYFAPVRDEAREQGLTEGEIEDAIDRAVAAVRARHD